MDWLHSILPLNFLSFCIGNLFKIPLPKPLSGVSVRTFASVVGANIDEAEYPLSHYRTIQQFFTRSLKPGLRPIGSELVSPIDGTFRNFQTIVDDWLEQIKGRRYSLTELLQDKDKASQFAGGCSCNFYLAPKDYHQVHSPVSGQVIAYRRIPGTLWPVNNWALSHIPDLFAINERLIVYIQSEHFGLVAVVFVGALNVGSIRIAFSDLNFTNAALSEGQVQLNQPIALSEGDKLGGFELGSSVIVLLQNLANRRWEQLAGSLGVIRFGQSLFCDK